MMSGDQTLATRLKACRHFASANQDVKLLLVGDEATLREGLRRRADDWQIVHAPGVVAMDEHPAKALRHKSDSSMHKALELVRDGKAQACISSGNTGALLAVSRHILGTVSPAIKRPAFIAPLPAEGGGTWMLDLGANLEVSAEQLLQFAQMGSVVATKPNEPPPRIGLINVGSEAMKGSQVVRDAAKLLEQSGLNYIGFVEGHDIFTGKVDVVVCDGITGNVALKSAEGAGALFLKKLSEALDKGMFTKIALLAARRALNAAAKEIDPRQFNGASFVGLNGVVIKSHGAADSLAFEVALGYAAKEARAGVPEAIRRLMGESS